MQMEERRRGWRRRQKQVNSEGVRDFGECTMSQSAAASDKREKQWQQKKNQANNEQKTTQEKSFNIWQNRTSLVQLLLGKTKNNTEN